MIEEQQTQLKQQYAELQKKINKRKEEQKTAAAAKTVSLILSTAAKKTKSSAPIPQHAVPAQVHDESPPPPPPPPGSPGRPQRNIHDSGTPRSTKTANNVPHAQSSVTPASQSSLNSNHIST